VGKERWGYGSRDGGREGGAGGRRGSSRGWCATCMHSELPAQGFPSPALLGMGRTPRPCAPGLSDARGMAGGKTRCRTEPRPCPSQVKTDPCSARGSEQPTWAQLSGRGARGRRGSSRGWCATCMACIQSFRRRAGLAINGCLECGEPRARVDLVCPMLVPDPIGLFRARPLSRPFSVVCSLFATPAAEPVELLPHDGTCVSSPSRRESLTPD
jgi:hypothetical protein